MPLVPQCLRLIALAAFVAASPGAHPATARATDINPSRIGGAERIEPHAAAAASVGPPTVRLWATRIGLVGHMTANGHVVAERDRFVALPSKRALNRKDATDYVVQLSYRGKTALAPVWDVGPWNMKDDYWSDTREQFSELPRWVPQVEAAFFGGHNGGRDAQGRFVTMPASIDLADGTFWDDLGMAESDWIDVAFLWVDAASPPQKPTPKVTVKTAPTQPSASPVSTVRRAASYNAPSPATRVFLPLVMHHPSGWTTPWTVQNATSAPVYGTADLYDTTGTRVGGLGFQLPPFGSDTFSAADVPGVSAGFVGGAVLNATGPVAVVVNEDRDGMDRMAYEGFTSGSAAVAAPLILKEYNGWSTGIQVQNLGSAPAMVQVSYARSAGGASQPAVPPDTALVPPMAATTFYQPANTSLPTSFLGSAVVQATNGQPLAVVVNEVRSDGAAMSYPGITAGSERLSVPLLLKRYNGWDTGLQLFNLSPLPASATILYQGMPQPVAENTVIPGNGSATLYQPAQAALPDGYMGSAAVVAAPGSRLAGIVNEVRIGEQAATNYTVGGTQAGSGLLAVPLVMNDDDGWDTSIHVQNTTDVPARVVATFYAETGGMVHRADDVLPAGATRTYNLPAISEIAAGFRGSALFQSVSGQPLTAVVDETSR